MLLLVPRPWQQSAAHRVYRAPSLPLRLSALLSAPQPASLPPMPICLLSCVPFCISARNSASFSSPLALCPLVCPSASLPPVCLSDYLPFSLPHSRPSAFLPPGYSSSAQLPICMPLRLSAPCLLLCISAPLSLSASLPICPHVCPSAYQPPYLPNCISAPHVSLSAYLPSCFPPCLSAFMCAPQPKCLIVCPSAYLMETLVSPACTSLVIPVFFSAAPAARAERDWATRASSSALLSARPLQL